MYRAEANNRTGNFHPAMNFINSRNKEDVEAFIYRTMRGFGWDNKPLSLSVLATTWNGIAWGLEQRRVWKPDECLMITFHNVFYVVDAICAWKQRLLFCYQLDYYPEAAHACNRLFSLTQDLHYLMQFAQWRNMVLFRSWSCAAATWQRDAAEAITAWSSMVMHCAASLQNLNRNWSTLASKQIDAIRNNQFSLLLGPDSVPFPIEENSEEEEEQPAPPPPSLASSPVFTYNDPYSVRIFPPAYTSSAAQEEHAPEVVPCRGRAPHWN